MGLDLEISPPEVKRGLGEGVALVLLDVREPVEHGICSIQGALPIPMKGVPGRLQEIGELAEQGTLVVYCHHGVRSLHVVEWLRKYGVGNCQSMAGGIERWSAEIDPAVPRYCSRDSLWRERESTMPRKFYTKPT